MNKTKYTVNKQTQQQMTHTCPQDYNQWRLHVKKLKELQQDKCSQPQTAVRYRAMEF
uniref:Uncharacterized protein n=1 Tax=Octopus bimaculoides TaxID=37653 RepID=A0A0L8FPG5_OCTBM